eukprot:SAG31_NODE_21129_length_557_cov_0.919214_1_plen_138_part_10
MPHSLLYAGVRCHHSPRRPLVTGMLVAALAHHCVVQALAGWADPLDGSGGGIGESAAVRTGAASDARMAINASGDDADQARLQMVSCLSTRALNLSAPTIGMGKSGLLRVANSQSCIAIHNTTVPGTCADAVGTACSL